MTNSPPESAYKRESRASFLYEPDNKRRSDSIKIQRRMSEQYLYPYKFVVAADTQITPDRLKYWQELIEQVNQFKPKFLVIAGDICESPPTGNAEYAMRRQQERDFFTALDSLDDAVYFIPVPGEHDVGVEPNHNTINRYRLSFGQDYFDFMVAGMRFITLNSQYYMNANHVESLKQEQENWLDEKLSDGNNGPLGPIIFMHTPPFVKTVDEADSPSALSKTKRKPFLEKLNKHGVRFIFCGHLHTNGLQRYSNIEIITTTSLADPRGSDKHGFRVVTLYENKLTHEYVPLVTASAQPSAGKSPKPSTG